MLPVKASGWFNTNLTDLEREGLMKSGIVPVNDLFYPFWYTNHRYEIYYGGRGSGKSRFIPQKLVKNCIEQKYFKCIYARKYKVDIKESQYEVLKNTIDMYGVRSDFKFNETTMKITCNNGNSFIAKGMDDPEKVKSIEEPSCIWFEEATEADEEDINTLNSSLRTTKAPLQSILSFNPIQLEHWIRKKFFKDNLPHEITDDLMGRVVPCRSTLNDNYFIDREQYKQDLLLIFKGDQNALNVNLNGEWGIESNNNPWLYNFDPNKHLKQVEFLPAFPVYLSFDFNNDPFACVAYQFLPNLGVKASFLHYIKEFSGFIKLEEMCQRIKSTYPASILFVTGDRSGNNEDIGRNQTLYEMIQSILLLSDKQMHLNTHNLEHADSRLLCNIMLQNYPNMFINPLTCPNLARQCQAAAIDIDSPRASQLLKDRGMNKNDELDAFRYSLQTYFNKFVRETFLKVLKK